MFTSKSKYKCDHQSSTEPFVMGVAVGGMEKRVHINRRRHNSVSVTPWLLNPNYGQELPLPGYKNVSREMQADQPKTKTSKIPTQHIICNKNPTEVQLLFFLFLKFSELP